MSFEAMPYILWAKSHLEMERSLAWSFAPYHTLEDLIRDYSIDPASLSILPSLENAWALRTLVANRYYVPEHHVLPVSSCTLANFLGIAAALSIQPESRRQVLIESPTYTPLIQQARAAGGEIREIRTWFNGETKHSELREAISERTALVILGNLNNPTGAALSPEVLSHICDAAANHGALVLVDEVYRDFLPATTVASAVDCGPNAIATESLSKIHGLAPLKIGWLVGPPPVITRAAEIYDHIGVNPPFIALDLAVKLLEQHWTSIVERARAFADERRATVDRFMAGRTDLRWHSPAGGLVGVLKPVNGTAEDLARRMLEEYKTVVVPGRFFNLPDYVRVGYGGPELEESLEVLGRCLDSMAEA